MSSLLEHEGGGGKHYFSDRAFFFTGGRGGGEDFFLGPKIFFYRGRGGGEDFFRTEDFFYREGGGGFRDPDKDKMPKELFFPPRGLHCSHSDIAMGSAD